mgnify:CR=1 FL=1
MSTKHSLLPLLPLRDLVVFPFMVIPLFVGREKSVCALEKSMAEQKNIFLSAQRNPDDNDPNPKDIYKELELREKILLKMVDLKVLNYYKVFDVIKRFYTGGVKNLPFEID